MSLLERIDPLLEVDVIRRKLGLYWRTRVSELSPASWGCPLKIRSYTVLSLTELLLGVLEGARRKRRDLRTKVAAYETLVVVLAAIVTS